MARQRNVCMPAYYLNIETAGLDPDEHSIITIQELEWGSGRPKGDL